MFATRILIACLTALVGSIGIASAASKAEVKEATDALVEFIEAGEYQKAQEEVDFLSAALKELDAGAKKKFFKDELAGYTGGEISAQSAMGMSVIERTYTKGGKSIKVSLAALGGGAGMAGLAAMGQMLGQQQGTFRLPGRIPAALNNHGGRTEVMATIGKSMFRVESSNASVDDVKAVAAAFPTKGLLAHEEGR